MKRTLLYVDDQPDNQVVFRAAFQSEFEVLEAACGQEALAILEKREVPLILSDQRMPGMSGVELFEVVKPRYPHTIRMILTGYNEPEVMMDAINKGHVYSFITKPWEREALLSTLIRGFETYELATSNSALTERCAQVERCATLGRLAAGIAHEMGNRLFIAPLFELIEEQYRDQEDLLKIAKIARQTHEGLSALIEEIKSFVRMEHGSYEMTDIRLDHLVHETISFARFDKKIPADCIAVRVEAESTVPANRLKLQQALLNLLTNAADAVSDRDQPRIAVSLELHGEEAVLCVEDNGCGIEEETLAKIWEPFFSTKGTDGTGVGLDITRHIIEAHEGNIDCSSTPGIGTTFTIRLPLAEGYREAACCAGAPVEVAT